MSDLAGLSISVVIPAFNEERRIPRAVAAVREYLGAEGARFEIVVVDDGSQDRTAEAVTLLGSAHADVKLRRLAVNSGKGAAVREGVLAATGDWVVFTDADQSTSIDHLGPLVAAMRQLGCPVGIASRAGDAALVRRQAWYREQLGKAFGVVMRSLLIRGVRDSQCGFKCFTAEASRAIFPQVMCRNALFDMEVLLLAARQGYAVAEIPARWAHDPDSRLVYSPAQAFGLVAELLRIRRRWHVGWPETVEIRRPVRSPAPTYLERDYLARAADRYAETKYGIVLGWMADARGGRVLNVGCGSGELNVLLARRGYQVDAVDVSAEAVALARRRQAESGVPGISIERGDLFTLSGEGRYDAVVCLDVLEHIEDDGGAVTRLTALLKPGGRLLVSVPALPALYGYHDRELGHHRRYSRGRLRRLLAERLVVERSRYLGFSLIPLAVLYSKLLRRSYPVHASSGALGRMVFAVEGRIRPPLGTSLLAVARRPTEEPSIR